MNEEDVMDNEDTRTKPVGFFVTIKEIHNTVMNIADKLDNEVSKLKSDISGLKSQLAAQWVIQGIQIATIIYLIQKGIG